MDSSIWEDNVYSVEVEFDSAVCSVHGIGQYEENEDVIIKCDITDDIYAFRGWKDKDSGEIITKNPLTFKADSNKEYLAVTEFIGVFVSINVTGLDAVDNGTTVYKCRKGVVNSFKKLKGYGKYRFAFSYKDDPDEYVQPGGWSIDYSNKDSSFNIYMPEDYPSDTFFANAVFYNSLSQYAIVIDKVDGVKVNGTGVYARGTEAICKLSPDVASENMKFPLMAFTSYDAEEYWTEFFYIGIDGNCAINPPSDMYFYSPITLYTYQESVNAHSMLFIQEELKYNIRCAWLGNGGWFNFYSGFNYLYYPGVYRIVIYDIDFSEITIRNSKGVVVLRTSSDDFEFEPERGEKYQLSFI